MAKKSRVPSTDLERWLSRIKRAESIRDDADKKFGFTRALQQYQGDYEKAIPKFIAETDLIPINEVYAFAKTFVPSVYSRDPFIAINPKGIKWIAGSKILEIAINAYWRELRLKREIRRIMFDAVFAEGWMKTGYTSQAEKDDVETSEYVKSEEIFAVRVSWKNMVRDPDAINGIKDARWVAQQIIKPLDVVRASSLYENTKDLQPSHISSYPTDQKYRTGDYKDEVEYVCLWEVWDRDNETVFTISDQGDKFLMKKDWPYEMEGFPFELLRFNENPDEAYSPNLIQAWEPQLWEKIKLRSMQLDHIKRFGRQLSAEKGSLSPAEMQKFKQGRTGSIILHEQGKNPPAPIPYPQIQSDMYSVGSLIDLDKDNISGQPNAVRSAPQKTQSRTLGEIDRLISAFQSRQSEPQSLIEDFAGEVAYKLIALMKQFISAPKFVRATQTDMVKIMEALVDPETGEPMFDQTGFKFTKEQIQGTEFEIDVRAGSTLPLNKETRLDSMVSILKLGPTIGIQPGGKVSRVLGKAILGDFEMKEVEQAYDEEMQDMENEKTIAMADQAGQIDIAEAEVQGIREMNAKNMAAGGPAL